MRLGGTGRAFLVGSSASGTDYCNESLAWLFNHRMRYESGPHPRLPALDLKPHTLYPNPLISLRKNSVPQGEGGRGGGRLEMPLENLKYATVPIRCELCAILYPRL